MAEKEAGVIEHLLDVERLASGLMLDAQKEADKRISEAKGKADGLYKNRYDELVSKCEKTLSEQEADVSSKHDKAFSDYKKKIETTPKDIPDFNSLLGKLFASS